MASGRPSPTSGIVPPTKTADPANPESLRRSSSIQFSPGTKTSSSPSRQGTSTGTVTGTMTSPRTSPLRQVEGAVNEQTPIDPTSRPNYQTSHSPSRPQKTTSSTDTDPDPQPQTRPKRATSNTTRHRTRSPSPTGDDSKQEPWYQRLASKYGSIELENKGSVARDHLALERTFLAWVRTSLAFASIGIAVTQLFRLNTTIANRDSSRSISVPYSPFLTPDIPLELLPQQSGPSSNSLSLHDGASSSSDLEPYDIPPSSATKLRHIGKPLGATFLAISILILFIGFHRYFESQHWIVRGKFPASRGSIALVGLVAGALIVASLVVVLAVAPTSFEK